jgi:hypothetical protein
MIKYSCRFCGVPLDENLNIIDKIPETFNPNDYEHNVCGSCMNEESSHGMRQVTRDMAMDAGDLRLEGQWIEL